VYAASRDYLLSIKGYVPRVTKRGKKNKKKKKKTSLVVLILT
jgi:hypothetical protein